MNQQIATGRPTKHLTEEQLTHLKAIVLGYGNFRKASIEGDIPEPTLRIVMLRGYGEPESVDKILKLLDGRVKAQVSINQ